MFTGVRCWSRMGDAGRVVRLFLFGVFLGSELWGSQSWGAGGLASPGTFGTRPVKGT